MLNRVRVIRECTRGQPWKQRSCESASREGRIAARRLVSSRSLHCVRMPADAVKVFTDLWISDHKISLKFMDKIMDIIGTF